MTRFLLFTFGLIFLMTSCNELEEGVDEANVIVITNPYGSHLITDYDIAFSAEDAAGNDITSNVTFYIDGEPQTGNMVNFSQPGTYTITAKMELDGRQINSMPYEVVVEYPQNSTKVLVEDFTGTWCVNCPRVVYHLEEAVAQNDHIIPVAIHQSRFPGDDPFGFEDYTTLADDYDVTALPTTVINRINGNEGRWDEEYSSLQNYLNTGAPLGLKIVFEDDDTHISLDVSVHFSMDMNQQDLRLVLYLVENGLHADQQNATPFYDGQNPIPDFEQKHVLRKALNGLYGTVIDANNAVAGNTITQTFELGIPDNVTDINNCDIVAFVINETRGKVVENIQKVAFGTTQDFD